MNILTSKRAVDYRTQERNRRGTESFVGFERRLKVLPANQRAQLEALFCALAASQFLQGIFATMTSKLERYLSKELYTRFGQYSIRQNYRPDWLEGLELDFYIDELKLAAEVQGEQHYSFVEYFHRTKENFEAQKTRDANKSYLCRLNKIELVEIHTEKDADLFVRLVAERSTPVIVELVLDNRQAAKEKQRNKEQKSKLNKLYKKHFQRYGE